MSVTQVTELGTCYSLAELRALGDFCRGHELRLYIDGARLANAVAHLDCTVADIAAQADVLSFGGTKNGAVAAEAVLVMSGDLVEAVPFQRKQLLQLASKMRFLAAQFAGLLEGRTWLRNAAQSNSMAQRLADGLRDVPGVSVRWAVQSNAVFADLDSRMVGALQDDWGFYVWDGQRNTVRLMTAFDTRPATLTRSWLPCTRPAGPASEVCPRFHVKPARCCPGIRPRCETAVVSRETGC